MLNVDALQPGDCVRFVAFGHTEMSYRRKLLSMGLTSGVEVTILSIAPLGCPIQIDLRGTKLILRKQEAAHLHWEYVE